MNKIPGTPSRMRRRFSFFGRAEGDGGVFCSEMENLAPLRAGFAVFFHTFIVFWRESVQNSKKMLKYAHVCDMIDVAGGEDPAAIFFREIFV